MSQTPRSGSNRAQQAWSYLTLRRSLDANQRFFLILALGIALFLLVAWYFSNIFAYVVISAVLSTILRPLVSYMQALYLFGVRLPRVVAVILSFFVLIAILSVVVLLFVPLISDQVQILADLDYEGLADLTAGPLDQVEALLIDRGVVNEEPGFIADRLEDALYGLADGINVTAILNSVISVTGNVLVGLLAVVFITFFFTYEKGLIRRQVISLIPNQYFELIIVVVYKTQRLLSNYLIGLLFQMAAIFSIASIGLSIMGIPYAFTIALFAAVANLIPYAGPLLGGLFGILVGVSTTGEVMDTNGYFWLVAKIFSVFSVVQMTDNLVLQPMIFSKSVKAHPLEIFVIIFAGAKIANILGMIAAIPVYTIIRVSITELYKGYRQYHIFHLNKREDPTWD